MTVRARFDGKAFVPIDPVDLPVDQMVELDIRHTDEMNPPRGSPARILQVLRELPPVSKEAMEEFNAAL